MTSPAHDRALHHCADGDTIAVECPDGHLFQVPVCCAGAIVGCTDCPWEGTVCTALEVR